MHPSGMKLEEIVDLEELPEVERCALKRFVLTLTGNREPETEREISLIRQYVECLKRYCRAMDAVRSLDPERPEDATRDETPTAKRIRRFFFKR